MMDAVFLKILNMSLTASWIVLAVLVLRLLLQKAPKWINCLLWGVVGLRLIFPFSIESLFSLIPSAEPLPSDLPMTQTPAIDSGFEVIDEVVNPILSESFAPTPEVSANPMQIVIAVAAIVWLCGLVGMIAYGAISYLRLRLRVRASICQDGNVYFCDDIDSPFILGVIRPRIYLPSGMTQEQMGYVIGHERAHLRRLDHIWKPLGFALLCLHWFNPLLWVAYILLCRDIEKACDEKVIRDMDDESKKGYSETLVACSVHRRAVMACPLAFGEVGVKDRIKSVLHYKKPAFWIILVAVVALVVTGVCFLTDPIKKLIDPPNVDTDKKDAVFSDIDYYEWTGELDEESFITATNEYLSANMQPVVYSLETVANSIEIKVDYSIFKSRTLVFGRIVGDAATEFQNRSINSIGKTEENSIYVDIGSYLTFISGYDTWFVVVQVADLDLVNHNYYFRVDNNDCWTDSSRDAKAALRLIGNRDLKYSHSVYAGVQQSHTPPELYINSKDLYRIDSGGAGMTKIGSLIQVDLKKANFDSSFVSGNTLGGGLTAEELRKNNAMAWEIRQDTQGDTGADTSPLYLLYQKDKTVLYLCGRTVNAKKTVYAAYGYEVTETLHMRMQKEQHIYWDISNQSRMRLDEFLNLTFRYTGNVILEDSWGDKYQLDQGIVRTVIFADLNQDGYRECIMHGEQNKSMCYIRVYDLKNEAVYTLDNHDFYLHANAITGTFTVSGIDDKTDAFLPQSTMRLTRSGGEYILELCSASGVWYQVQPKEFLYD